MDLESAISRNLHPLPSSQYWACFSDSRVEIQTHHPDSEVFDTSGQVLQPQMHEFEKASESWVPLLYFPPGARPCLEGLTEGEDTHHEPFIQPQLYHSYHFHVHIK